MTRLHCDRMGSLLSGWEGVRLGVTVADFVGACERELSGVSRKVRLTLGRLWLS